METFNFNIGSGVDNIDNKLYLSPLLFLKITENPFRAESREYPVDFEYAYVQNQTVNVSFPSTLEIESIPESINIKLPNDIGAYTYQVFTTGSKIVIRTQLKYNSSKIDANYYESLQLFVKQRIEKESESIVFKNK